MEITFCGKTALVTGATKGIGRDMAKQLCRCGARVYAVGRSKKLLDTLQQENPTIQIIMVDLCNWKETEELLKDVVDKVDLLVNNAARGKLNPLPNVTEEEIDNIFGVNIKALMHVTQMVVTSLMQRRKRGSIVNISSQASMAGLTDHSVYCASKSAVDGFTRAAALECGPYNIRVNAVNPTVVVTDTGRLGWNDPVVAEPMLKKVPLGRFGEPHEVVDTVLFLLSDYASMITGICLPIDGGFLAT